MKTWKAAQVVLAKTICVAALSLGAASSWSQESPRADRSAPSAVGVLAQADVKLLGLAFTGAFQLDEAESQAWAKMLLGYKSAMKVEVASFKPSQLAAGGMSGADSGFAMWTPEGCRILLPARSSALAGLAEFSEVSIKRAKELRLDELEAAHEMGHCVSFEPGVSFRLPGLGVDMSKALAERVFSPSLSSLDQAGLGSRLWGESFADAFMAIERLAIDKADAKSQEALEIAKQARARDAERAGDALDHSSGRAIELALARARDWSSMSADQRLEAAMEIASRSAIEDIEKTAGLSSLVKNLESESLARAALEDAAARWAQAHEQGQAYEDFDGSLASGSASRPKEHDRMERLIAVAKGAVKAAAEHHKIDWARATHAQVESLLSTARKQAEFGRVVDEFESASPYWRQALALAKSYCMGLGISGKLSSRQQAKPEPAKRKIQGF